MVSATKRTDKKWWYNTANYTEGEDARHSISDSPSRIPGSEKRVNPAAFSKNTSNHLSPSYERLVNETGRRSSVDVTAKYGRSNTGAAQKKHGSSGLILNEGGRRSILIANEAGRLSSLLANEGCRWPSIATPKGRSLDIRSVSSSQSPSSSEAGSPHQRMSHDIAPRTPTRTQANGPTPDWVPMDIHKQSEPEGKGNRAGIATLFPNLTPLEMREPPPDYCALRVRETLGILDDSPGPPGTPAKIEVARSLGSDSLRLEALLQRRAYAQGRNSPNLGRNSPNPEAEEAGLQAEDLPPRRFNELRQRQKFVTKPNQDNNTTRRRHTVSVGRDSFYTWEEEVECRTESEEMTSQHNAKLTAMSRCESPAPFSRPHVAGCGLVETMTGIQTESSYSDLTLGRAETSDDVTHYPSGRSSRQELNREETLVGSTLPNLSSNNRLKRPQLHAPVARFDPTSDRDLRSQFEAYMAHLKARNRTD